MPKELIKNFMIYGAGNVLQAALNLLLLPMYLRFFTPSEYGVISLLAVVITLLTLLISGGALNGLVRLYYEVNGIRRKELVGNTFLWYLVIAGAGCAVLFFFAVLISQSLFHSETYETPVRMTGFVFFFSVLMSVPLFIMRLEKKAVQYVSFSLLIFLIDFCLKLYFIISLGRGITGYFESSALAYLITLVMTIPFFLRYVRFTFDIVFLKQILRLGVPYIISGLAMWTLDVSDRLLLSYFSGAAAVGIYSLAYNFANIFSLLLATPIALLFDPFFFSYAAERSTEDSKRLLQRTLVYYFIVGGILYLGISLGSGELLRIFTTYFGVQGKYLEAVKLIPVITIGPFLYFLTSQAGFAGLLIKKPEIISASCLTAAVINFLLNLFIIPLFGAMGAAITTVIAYLLLIVLAYWLMERIFPVRYDWKRVLRLIAYLLVAFFTCWFIKLNQPIISLIVRVVLGITIFSSLTLYKNNILTKTEREKIFSHLNLGKKKLVERG